MENAKDIKAGLLVKNINTATEEGLELYNKLKFDVSNPNGQYNMNYPDEKWEQYFSSIFQNYVYFPIRLIMYKTANEQAIDLIYTSPFYSENKDNEYHIIKSFSMGNILRLKYGKEQLEYYLIKETFETLLNPKSLNYFKELINLLIFAKGNDTIIKQIAEMQKLVLFHSYPISMEGNIENIKRRTQF